MPSCPNCQQHLDEDFGLVECPKCHAAVFVEFDGEAKIFTREEMLDEPGEVAAPPPEAFGAATDQSEDEAQPHDEMLAAPFVTENYFDSEELEPIEQLAPVVKSPPPPPAPPVDFDPTPPADFASVADHGQQGQQDFADVAEFANSQASSGQEGLIRYDVMINGIDSAEIRAELKDVLTDRRFLWNADEFMARIRNGELVVPNLGPLKSAILVGRLRALPVSVEWTQRHLVSS